MDEAFIIMQIGNAELDQVCDEAIVPAIKAAGLAPRRVDRHNAGDLLKSEIVNFIERAQIIVADVTNERPNCYLEIGYAMGLGKNVHLILTARHDHFHGHPDHVRDGPKVHFDLEGYDILFWDPADRAKFREELTTRIRRRTAIVRRSRTAEPGAAWLDELRAPAVAGLAALGRTGYMEISATVEPATQANQRELLAAISEASVHAFGWPIGVVLDRDEYRPRPTPDGIVAEIAIADTPEMGPMGRSSYDFWKLFRDGRFYTLLSLHEDAHTQGVLWFDVRISRVTEAFLLLARLYRRLGASDNDRVVVTVRHTDLAGRKLMAAARDRDIMPRESTEDTVESTLTVRIGELESRLGELVKTTVDPLFMVFDFFQLGDAVVYELVDRFVDRV
jgi:hypothetical protein